MGVNVLIADDSKETRREFIRALRKDHSLESIIEAGKGFEALQDKLKTHLRQPERLSIIDELPGFQKKKVLVEFFRREIKAKSLGHNPFVFG
jgi:hypothetical protein